MSASDYLRSIVRGVDLVAELAAAPGEIAASGVSRAHAQQLHALCEVYFGPTTYTGKQREAVTAARRMRHDLDSLLNIESKIRRQRGKLDKWRLRIKLCSVHPDHVNGVAKKHFAARPRKKPQPGVVVIRRQGGPNTLAITASSLVIATMEGVLRASNPQDLLEGAKNVIIHGQAAAAPKVVTNVIVKLEDFVKILHGDGDDLTLQLTNGAVMTGRDYLAHALAKECLFTLVSPVHGPVNLYRTERFASAKQRRMLSALYPRCVWPGCAKPSDLCETHHIKGWKNGGMTNLDNLVPLCKYHNSNNETGRRGHIARIAGHTAWVPPRR